EQPLPAPKREPPAIQHSQIVRLARLRDRLERSQISPEIAQVGIADSRERGVRQRGKVMCAIGPFAFAERARGIRERPACDAGLRMRRDVRTVKRTEGRLERAPAGVRRGILALFGVTAEATARLREVLAAFS